MEKHIRIIPHEESIEVRVSSFFYFTEDASRRAVTKRMTREEAEEAAKAYAKQLRDA